MIATRFSLFHLLWLLQLKAKSKLQESFVEHLLLSILRKTMTRMCKSLVGDPTLTMMKAFLTLFSTATRCLWMKTFIRKCYNKSKLLSWKKNRISTDDAWSNLRKSSWKTNLSQRSTNCLTKWGTLTLQFRKCSKTTLNSNTTSTNGV